MQSIGKIINQLFMRKDKFFPPYFFAFIFLICISLQFIFITVFGIIELCRGNVSDFSLWEIVPVLGLTAGWMTVYKITDDRNQ